MTWRAFWSDFMSLDISWFILWLVLIGGIAFFVKRRKKIQPALPISASQFLKGKKSARLVCARCVEPFLWVSSLLLAISLSNPTEKMAVTSSEKSPLPSQGIALYFVLDQSGSMDEKVSTQEGPMQKMSLAKNAIAQFVKQEERSSDLIGLIAFARTAQVISPLSLDRSTLLHRLEAITPIEEERLNGTAIGYAIFKAVNIMVATKHFISKVTGEPLYSIKNQAIVLVTDGLQSPHPDDANNPYRYMFPDEAITYATDNGIRVYFIGVDPIFAAGEFAQEVSELRKGVIETGGAFFLMTPATPVEDIFAKINSLEKGVLPPVPHPNFERRSLVPYFLAGAFFFLVFACLIETLIARRYP